jgi:hypothetical protein
LWDVETQKLKLRVRHPTFMNNPRCKIDDGCSKQGSVATAT